MQEFSRTLQGRTLIGHVSRSLLYQFFCQIDVSPKRKTNWRKFLHWPGLLRRKRTKNSCDVNFIFLGYCYTFLILRLTTIYYTYLDFSIYYLHRLLIMYYQNCQNTYYAKYKPKFYLQTRKDFFFGGVLANHFLSFYSTEWIVWCAIYRILYMKKTKKKKNSTHKNKRKHW